MHNSRFLIALCLAGALAVPAKANDVTVTDTPPKRVVSMNLCTDQLAMMIAGPGQLYSVSYLARDPSASAMADEAQNYEINRGLAEEIYLMQPDLVIAGSFSARTTFDMLKRLGVPVVVFDPAYGMKDVRENLLQMGKVLGRDDAAQTLIQDFDRRLDALHTYTGPRPHAALYYANGYTSGDKTLAGQILIAAGFENTAVKAGFASGGTLPLEVLAMLEPDALISGQRYPGASRAEEILDHPVVGSLRQNSVNGTITDRDWVCGTPFVLRAIDSLAQVRNDMTKD